jgi:hypothetical protein
MLTDAGRVQLGLEKEGWQRSSDAINEVLGWAGGAA